VEKRIIVSTPTTLVAIEAHARPLVAPALAPPVACVAPLIAEAPSG